MSLCCPLCGSQYVLLKNNAQKVGGVIGLVGGAVVGTFKIWPEPSTKLPKAPMYLMIVGIYAALSTILAIASTGEMAAARFGQVIDEAILCQYLCAECQHSFTHRTHHSFDTDSSF